MRIAFADPPYWGQGKRYPEHPDAKAFDAPDTHRRLIARLITEFPDGWALSLSTPSLRVILPMCPEDCRIGAWTKPFAIFKPGVNPGYCWEPVIWRGGRRRGRDLPTARDYCAVPITLKRGLCGAKPDGFCRWLFELLGLEPEDEFVDLFPGSGAVGRAWEEYRLSARDRNMTAAIVKPTPNPEVRTCAPSPKPAGASPEIRGAVSPDDLRPSPTNPRKSFSADGLNGLVESICSHGIIQPLVVRPMGEKGRFEKGEWRNVDHFEVVAGERRLRAAKLAELEKVPVVIRFLTDVEVLEIQLIENDQREDVKPSEQAAAYGRLVEAGKTLEQVAATTGKPVAFVRSILALAKLPGWAQGAVDAGALPRRTAEAVARIPDEVKREQLAAMAVEGTFATVKPDRLKKLQAGKFPKDELHNPLTYREVSRAASQLNGKKKAQKAIATPPVVANGKPAKPAKRISIESLGLEELVLDNANVCGSIGRWNDKPKQLPVIGIEGQPHVIIASSWLSSGRREWLAVPLWTPEEFAARHPGEVSAKTYMKDIYQGAQVLALCRVGTKGEERTIYMAAKKEPKEKKPAKAKPLLDGPKVIQHGGEPAYVCEAGKKQLGNGKLGKAKKDKPAPATNGQAEPDMAAAAAKAGGILAKSLALIPGFPAPLAAALEVEHTRTDVALINRVEKEKGSHAEKIRKVLTRVAGTYADEVERGVEAFLNYLYPGRPKSKAKAGKVEKPRTKKTAEEELEDLGLLTKHPPITEPVGDLALRDVDGFPALLATKLEKASVKTLADLEKHVTRNGTTILADRPMPDVIYQTIVRLVGGDGYSATAARDALMKHLQPGWTPNRELQEAAT